MAFLFGARGLLLAELGFEGADAFGGGLFDAFEFLVLLAGGGDDFAEFEVAVDEFEADFGELLALLGEAVFVDVDFAFVVADALTAVVEVFFEGGDGFGLGVEFGGLGFCGCGAGFL